MVSSLPTYVQSSKRRPAAPVVLQRVLRSVLAMAKQGMVIVLVLLLSLLLVLLLLVFCTTTPPAPLPVIATTISPPAPLPVIDTSYTTSYNSRRGVPASSSSTMTTAPTILSWQSYANAAPVVTVATSYSLTIETYSDSYTPANEVLESRTSDKYPTYIRGAHDSYDLSP